ncbi:hypothetical protein GIB67_009384, partial [Kingdonia uniflora]
MMSDGTDQDQQSRLLYELCALVLTILRSPQSQLQPQPQPTITPSSLRQRSSTSTSVAKVSPACFASLLLGISMALMLCGSVTFMIGFLLMPWVFGLVMILYFVGIISTFSWLMRAIICPSSSSLMSSNTSSVTPSTSSRGAPSRKEMSETSNLVSELTRFCGNKFDPRGSLINLYGDVKPKRFRRTMRQVWMERLQAVHRSSSDFWSQKRS